MEKIELGLLRIHPNLSQVDLKSRFDLEKLPGMLIERPHPAKLIDIPVELIPLNRRFRGYRALEEAAVAMVANHGCRILTLYEALVLNYRKPDIQFEYNWMINKFAFAPTYAESKAQPDRKLIGNVMHTLVDFTDGWETPYGLCVAATPFTKIDRLPAVTEGQLTREVGDPVFEEWVEPNLDFLERLRTK